MNTDPNRAKAIFLEALERHAPDEWPAFLDRVCAGQPELRGHVEALLAAHREVGTAGDREPVEGADAGPAATADEPPACEQPGAVIGPYKLIEQVGEGGFGVVFLAEQTRPVRRKVALKVLKPGMDTRQVVARFEAERQALAIMDHPHIAKVFDGGATLSGRPYFVMELVRGVPITEFCDQNHFTPRERLELFLPVCQAVQHAHQKGLIHRDLKPSNVLVSRHDTTPVVKVIDFGVAKALGQELTDKTLCTGVAQMVGTPLYMSPEQAGLSDLDVDTRSDVYSLGVLLYELLTGTTPFTKERFKQVAYDEIRRIIREEEPPRPSTRLSESKNTLPSISAQRHTEPAKLTKLVRGELDWMVMKALEKDRNRRYETANGFALDVERYLRDEPVEASAPGAGYRLRKFLKRNKGPVVAAGLVLVALLAGMAGTTWGILRADQALREAESAQFAEAERAKESQRRLAQIEKGTAVLASVFRDLSPRTQEKEGVTLRVLLGRRLGEAVQHLEGEAVGDPLLVAQLQHVLGASLHELGHLEHAEAVLVKARQTRERLLGAEHLDTVATKHNLAGVCRDQGRYARAEALYKEVVALRTGSLGIDHADTLASRSDLAALYYFQGKYRQAEVLSTEILALRTAKLGGDHPETLDSRNGLAVLYRTLGKYSEAETLFKQVLALRTAKLGADHPDTGQSKYNLAALYQFQGKYPQAEALYRDALATGTAKLGADHPTTLEGRNGLSALYQSQGKYAQAEALYREALLISAARMGADHPTTLTTQNNLAVLYLEMAKYPQAEALFEEVVALRSAKLGADHADTLAGRIELAELYHLQGRYPQAEALHKEVLALCTAKLGADHPTTLASRDNLGSLYHSQKKYPEAEALTEQLLALRTASLGADHPETLRTKNNLALEYKSQGKFSKAEALYREALEISTASLGADHRIAIQGKHNLAALYHAQGRDAQAEALYREAIELKTAKLGADHPDSLHSKHNLATLYHAQKKYGPAEALFKEVFVLRTAKLGADHPDTTTSQNNLAAMYWSMKKLDLSIPLFEEALRLTKVKFGPNHLETLLAQANLGVNYRDAGRFADAFRLLEDVRQKGRNNSQLAWVDKALLKAYARAGKPAEATALVTEQVRAARAQLPADSPQLAAALADAGKALLEAKAYDAAEPLLRESLSLGERTAPDAWNTHQARSVLGGALLGQKKHADAEPLLVRGYQGMKKTEKSGPRNDGPSPRQQLIEALERLVQLYDAWNKPEEAAKWRQELAGLTKAAGK
jgi:serine/threonine protein kinase/tetratricopeptide (TPR) repeat protein